ncbi:HAMP domain-containing sensor histidine kinase [Mucilaginibacter sp. KACC 22063]|uniref:HAMP domain-containing sensor histidine kinase n=1 Tax=Mucilaginibacter sp. KACC 22063 TaxID=3025666 RepID=UPI002365939E|nr:ATP-binding protein [Mucilaginibacter sp. KACC 22063]WDF54966.1 ATP-binding protein [Mucilaginibacter sp. KACC 22063]
MKIKNKLRLGFAFLFIVVLFFGATSLYYIQDISKSAKVILKNNYETLSYTKGMRTILDEHNLPLDKASLTEFDKQLTRQEHNITEPGESQATAALRAVFIKMQSESSAAALQSDEREIRHYLRTIEGLNMQAIVKKNDKAHASVNRATIFLSFVGGFTFLILFSFSVNFPDIINSPLRALLEGIREISHKNYSQRLRFNKDDEFGEVATAFNDMASRLNDWENSNLAMVLSDKQRIETIIEQMDDAIIGLNEKQEILFINKVAENVLNLNEQKLVGQPAAKFTVSNDLFKSILESKDTANPFKIALNGKEAFFKLESREIVIPNMSGQQSEGVVISRKSAGKVYMLRNITEFKERDEAKTNFIATISHELKTPISAIKMSLKLLNDQRIGEMNSQQKELLAHISDDSDRLLKITSELLDLSQVETGNIQLNFVPSDPAAIVDYALNSVRFPAEQKSISLQVEAQPQLPKVQVDVEKTAWVLVNFLSNALRYSSEKSKVIIGVSAHQNQVIFSVKDFGKGIDEQYQKRLFERYFQVPTDGQSKAGTGLGLAISKDFIEAQNGHIWVESAIGEGSTFYFSLPAYQA